VDPHGVYVVWHHHAGAVGIPTRRVGSAQRDQLEWNDTKDAPAYLGRVLSSEYPVPASLNPNTSIQVTNDQPFNKYYCSAIWGFSNWVFPLPGTTDVRAPSGPVPASVKWLNDQLDASPSLARDYGNAPLAASASISHGQTVGALRQINGQKAADSVKLATQQSTAKNADAWSNVEADALEHLIHTLDILSLGSPAPTISQEKAHAKVNLNGQGIDVVAIRHQWLAHLPDLSPPYRTQGKIVHRPWFSPAESEVKSRFQKHNGKGRAAPRMRGEAAQAPARKRTALDAMRNWLEIVHSHAKGGRRGKPDDFRNTLLIDEKVILPPVMPVPSRQVLSHRCRH
jgi:hypothetical protein